MTVENTGQGSSLSEATSAEMSALLALLRTYFDPAAPVVSASTPGVDWRHVGALAERHRVFPLFAHRLRAEQVPGISDALMAEFSDRFRLAQLRNALLWDEFLKVAACLSDEGIDTLTFKGPTLARQYYGDLGLRRFMDLDILVAAEAFPRCRDVLRRLGYRPWFDLGARQEQALMHYRGVHTYSRTDRMAQFDVHTRLEDSPFAIVHTQQAWERACEETDEAVTYRVLSPEDSLLYVCAHGSKHRWEELAYVLDVGSVVNRASASLDWGSVLRRAEMRRRAPVLLTALNLSRDLLGIPLADEVQHALNSGSDGVRQKEISRRMAQLVTAVDDTAVRERLQLTRRLLPKGVPRLHDKWIRRILLPTGLECRLFAFPPPLFFLYRLARVGRLLCRPVWRRFRPGGVPQNVCARGGLEKRILDQNAFASLSAELIESAGRLRFRAHGRSMWPFVRDGDVLLVTKVGVDQLRVGDIVLHQAATGAVLAHRVVGRDGEGRWLTRGDALIPLDPPVVSERLLGRVACVERHGRSCRMDGGFRHMAGRLWVLLFDCRRVIRGLMHRFGRVSAGRGGRGPQLTPRA